MSFYNKASKYSDEVDLLEIDIDFEKDLPNFLFERSNTAILEYLSKHLDK
ncbi:hypothetical protein NBRC116495_28720 [Aurantivibrio plasticivorans]